MKKHLLHLCREKQLFHISLINSNSNSNDSNHNHNHKHINVLSSPSSFYNVMLEGMGKSRKRIDLTALYIGNGNLERKLLLSSGNVNDRDNDNLINNGGKGNFIFDYNRSTRNKNGALNLLSEFITGNCNHNPIVNNDSSSSNSSNNVFLFRSPLLKNGLSSLLMGERNREIFGVQHTKIAVFDNDLILTGANLETNYFTNRQDRYIVFRDFPLLSDFYHRFVADYLASVSVPLQFPFENAKIHQTNSHIKQYCQQASLALHNFLKTEYVNQCKHEEEDDQMDIHNINTIIIPTFQMAAFDHRSDERMLMELFAFIKQNKQLFSSCRIGISSPYFNFVDSVADAVVDLAKENGISCEIIVASPQANGFYGAKGLSGLIPDLYSAKEHDFLQKCHDNNVSHLISVHEYYRPNWTYHAKGIWIWAEETQTKDSNSNNNTSDKDNCYLMTMIGSSNISRRSFERDLEAQMLIFTNEISLRNQFTEEFQNLKAFTSHVSLESSQSPSFRISILSRLLSSFL